MFGELTALVVDEDGPLRLKPYFKTFQPNLLEAGVGSSESTCQPNLSDKGVAESERTALPICPTEASDHSS